MRRERRRFQPPGQASRPRRSPPRGSLVPPPEIQEQSDGASAKARFAVASRTDGSPSVLTVQNHSEQHTRHHDPRDDGCPGRSTDAHCGGANRPKIRIQLTNAFSTFASTSATITGRASPSLEISPERRIEQQRGNAPRERVEVRMGQLEHRGCSPRRQAPQTARARHRHGKREQEAQQKPVGEPPMTSSRRPAPNACATSVSSPSAPWRRCRRP